MNNELKLRHMRYGELLLKHRKKAGVTLEQLSEKVGYVGIAYLQQIEKGKFGKKPPLFERQVKIVDTLNIPLSEQYEFYRAAFEERLGEDGDQYQQKLKELQPTIEHKNFQKSIEKHFGQIYEPDIIDTLKEEDLWKLILFWRELSDSKKEAVLAIVKNLLPDQ